MDPASSARDFHVPDAGGAHFLFFVSRASKDRVSVRVDEARREETASAVDLRCFGKLFSEGTFIADGSYQFPVNGNRCVGEQARVRHLAPASCSSRTGTRDHLCSVDEQELCHWFADAITSRMRLIVSGACASPRHA